MDNQMDEEANRHSKVHNCNGTHEKIMNMMKRVRDKF